MKKLLAILVISLALLNGCWTKPEVQNDSKTSDKIPIPAANETSNPDTKNPDTVSPLPPEISIDEPQNLATITSPLKIKGSALNNWFFEASMPVELQDANGKIIANGTVQALTDWTMAGMIQFEGTLTFVKPATDTGKLILRNDNPSGLPQNSKSYEMTVMFGTTPLKTTSVKLYFPNLVKDPQMLSCDKVYPVTRDILSTPTIAKATIEELLKGPNTQETSLGSFSSIPGGVKVNKLTIVDGVAKVDFSNDLQKGVGGSCKVSTIRAEIEQTLLQFPTIKSVLISIEGDSTYILQP